MAKQPKIKIPKSHACTIARPCLTPAGLHVCNYCGRDITPEVAAYRKIRDIYKAHHGIASYAGPLVGLIPYISSLY